MAEPARAPAGRAPWGSISREDIVAEAVRMVIADGDEEFSIRSLAASLGVAPMSLYRHIRDKDDLLDEVVDQLLTDRWRPATAEDDWQAWTIEAATRLRDFLVGQPAALHVYLAHPVASPAAVDRMNAMMRVLRRTGIGEESAPERLWRRADLHHHRAVHRRPALPPRRNRRPRRRLTTHLTMSRGQIHHHPHADGAAVAALFGVTGKLTSPGGWVNSNIYGNFFPLIMLLLTIGYGAACLAGQDEEGTLAFIATLPARQFTASLRYPSSRRTKPVTGRRTSVGYRAVLPQHAGPGFDVVESRFAALAEDRADGPVR